MSQFTAEEWAAILDICLQKNGPRLLPTVVIDGKRYYSDVRMKQYRNVENPHDFMPM
jgi:hypothetical protein